MSQSKKKNVQEEATTEVVVTIEEANHQALGDLPKRPLEVIGGEIESIKANARGMFVACEAYARHSCFEIGKRLLEGKESVDHGQYLPWLETLGYTQQSANNLIRIYKEMGNDEAFKALTYTQMVELLPLAPEKRVEVLPEIEDKSSREIKRLVKELKAAEEEKLKAQTALGDAEELIVMRDKQIQKLSKENVDNFAAKTTAEAEAKKLKKDLNDKLKQANQMLAEATEIEKKKDAQIKELEAQVKKKEKRDLTDSELASIYRAAEKEVAAKQAKAEAQADPRLVEINLQLKDIQTRIFRVSNLITELSAEEREGLSQRVSLILCQCLHDGGFDVVKP